MVTVHRISEYERDQLRAMVFRYWDELMPHAPVVRDPSRRAVHFVDHFRLDDPMSTLWWARVDNAIPGFAKVDLWENHDGPGATIHDFYIERTWRRQGYGRAFAQRIVEELASRSVFRIDLNVRTDNPGALAFWRSVGFDLALYQLRCYLDGQADAPV